jgi:uncharacterized protein YndB with AHSA1/START domain
MSTAATIPVINRSVTVSAPAAKAFRVFTESLNSWWPPEYHIGAAEMAEAVLEPREGGRWYERGVDGSECDWGRVLTWDPPHRLVLTWQINAEWQFDPDLARASELEIRFVAGGPDETTVELEHRHIDRLVGGQQVYESVSGEGGWGTVLERLAKAILAE